MRQPVLVLLGITFAAASFAKLPPPTEETKAKAAEAAAKAAHGTKVGNYQLCKSMDAVAARYAADAAKAGKAVKPTETPACADPGPFAYTPQPPLEAAGAHSPPATAVAPPSGKATEAEIKGGVKK